VSRAGRWPGLNQDSRPASGAAPLRYQRHRPDLEPADIPTLR
jgi:hypothetical protein